MAYLYLIFQNTTVDPLYTSMHLHTPLYIPYAPLYTPYRPRSPPTRTPTLAAIPVRSAPCRPLRFTPQRAGREPACPWASEGPVTPTLPKPACPWGVVAPTGARQPDTCAQGQVLYLPRAKATFQTQGCMSLPEVRVSPPRRVSPRVSEQGPVGPPPGGTPPRVKATGKIWVVPAVGKEGRIPPRVCVCVCPTRVPRDPCGISPEDRPEWGVRGLRLQGPTTRPSLAGIQGGSHSGDEAGPPRVPPHGGPGPGCYRRVQSKSGFCRCLRSPAGRLPSCARPWGQKKVAGEQEDLQLPPHHPRGAIATLPGSGRWDGAGA